MKIRNYMKPSTVEEAYEMVNSGGTILGGGAWLKLVPKTIETAVDISGLGIDEISETDEHIYIGGMTTLRAIETSGILKDYMGGVVVDAASHIMGVTVRNIATIGGSVASRFGFSDMLTPLLALDATLEFHKHGLISLEEYLANPFKEKDLLIQVVLKKDDGMATYKSLKKTSMDFPVINASVARIGNHYRVSVGARPGVATVALSAMKMLNESEAINETMMAKVSESVGSELAYGTNSRGSAAYRAEVAKTLVVRCLKEVLQ